MIFPKDRDLSKEIITLAVPVIIGNLSRVFMGLADMAMVGGLGWMRSLRQEWELCWYGY